MITHQIVVCLQKSWITRYGLLVIKDCQIQLGLLIIYTGQITCTTWLNLSSKEKKLHVTLNFHLKRKLQERANKFWLKEFGTTSQHIFYTMRTINLLLNSSLHLHYNNLTKLLFFYPWCLKYWKNMLNRQENNTHQKPLHNLVLSAEHVDNT